MSNFKIINDDCLIALDKLEENSIDSIITDPPYELNFMNKGWDNAGVSFNKETWQKCLRVLKPGGYLLAFGGSRTFHRIACAIEDAGFEIRDTIMWLYGSGFPKSMNIGLAIDKKNGVDNRIGNIVKGVGSNNTNSMKEFASEYEERKAQNEWSGWGTCLKPSFEPIIMARKPFKGSCIDNVIKWGVGGINIDECRVGNEEIKTQGGNKFPNLYGNYNEVIESFHNGRFPANTILTYDQITFDEVCGGFPKDNKNNSATRYFYCAKASKKDRDEGLEEFGQQKVNDGRKKDADNAFQRGATLRHNIHPTVKPTELMQYLIRLVTPNNSTILDPFMGSGSTGKAAMYENKEKNKNYKFIGIEMNKEYCKIAEARIKYAAE